MVVVGGRCYPWDIAHPYPSFCRENCTWSVVVAVQEARSPKEGIGNEQMDETGRTRGSGSSDSHPGRPYRTVPRSAGAGALTLQQPPNNARIVNNIRATSTAISFGKSCVPPHSLHTCSRLGGSPFHFPTSTITSDKNCVSSRTSPLSQGLLTCHSLAFIFRPPRNPQLQFHLQLLIRDFIPECLLSRTQTQERALYYVDEEDRVLKISEVSDSPQVPLGRS